MGMGGSEDKAGQSGRGGERRGEEVEKERKMGGVR
jgi:hypothetical protein